MITLLSLDLLLTLVEVVDYMHDLASEFPPWRGGLLLADTGLGGLTDTVGSATTPGL
jgi:hypothetical protein